MNPLAPPVQALEPIPLWDQEYVTVSIIEGKVRIASHRTITQLSEFKRYEVLAIHRAAQRVGQIFREVFGTADFFEHWPVYPGKTIYAELIPCDGSSDFTDLVGKMKRCLYVLSGSEVDDCRMNHEQLQRIQEIAKQSLVIQPPPSSHRWELRWRHRFQAIRIVKDALEVNDITPSHSPKHPHGNPVQGEFNGNTLSDTTIRPIATCAFCTRKVLDTQTIAETRSMRLLINHRPFVHEKHLMAVSKRHVQKREGLTEEEIWEEHQLFVRMQRAWDVLFGPHMRICRFTQNGFLAGQTVPHCHTHFLADVSSSNSHNWLKNILRELEGCPKAPLTIEEMAPIIERYRNKLS